MTNRASEDQSRGIVRIVVALDSAPLYTLHRCEESFGGVAEEVPPTGSGGAAGEAAAAGTTLLTGVAHSTGGEHDNEPHAASDVAKTGAGVQGGAAAAAPVGTAGGIGSAGGEYCVEPHGPEDADAGTRRTAT